jgi:hypothetical protein
LLRLFAIVVVYGVTCVAWAVLGGITSARSSSQSSELRGKVEGLWGQPQAQTAPALKVRWTTEHTVRRQETTNGVERTILERIPESHEKEVGLAATHVDVDLHLDQRLKGLSWYSLYDVRFRGVFTYAHDEPFAGTLHVEHRFPDPAGVYDGFQITIDGAPREVSPKNGAVEVEVPVSPGQKIALGIAYKSRGMDAWRYTPDRGVVALRDFHVAMTTDFAAIDFPPGSLSPSTKEPEGAGMRLRWDFEQVVTGHDVGMAMPQRLQPGQLAASLSFSAPVSLLFFFVILMSLARLRGLDIHPVNYLFLGAAFFAFHLLFAYTVDRLPIPHAFALASAVSIALVTSYLRLVVSPRFAFVEAGLAQLVYLVGFSLAHFWEGYTGLTVTVLSIVTLFLLMQLTGRVRWGAPTDQVAAPARA